MFEYFRDLHLIRFARLSLTLYLIKLRFRSDEVLIQQNILIMVYFPLRCYIYIYIYICLTGAGGPVEFLFLREFRLIVKKNSEIVPEIPS